jgi:hypothetical protein
MIEHKEHKRWRSTENCVWEEKSGEFVCSNYYHYDAINDTTAPPDMFTITGQIADEHNRIPELEAEIQRLYDELRDLSDVIAELGG